MKLFIFLPFLFLLIQCSKTEPKAAHKAGYEGINGTSEAPETKVIGQENPEVINIASRLNFTFQKAEKTQYSKGEPVKIDVKIELQDPTSAWSLFISKNKDEITDAVAIFKSQPISKTSINWDTSFMEAGSYYLAAIVEVNGRHKLFTSDSPIQITAKQFAAPTGPVKIAITSPGTKTIYSPGEQINIEFEQLATAPEGATIQPQFSNDAGTTWQDIAQPAPIEGASFNMTLPTGRTADLQLRLKLIDSSGSIQYITQDGYFGVNETKIIGLDQIQPILQANCVSCHSGGGASAGVRLDRDRDLQGLRKRIIASTSPGAASPMPPSGPLSNNDRITMKMWEWFE